MRLKPCFVMMKWIAKDIPRDGLDCYGKWRVCYKPLVVKVINRCSPAQWPPQIDWSTVNDVIKACVLLFSLLFSSAASRNIQIRLCQSDWILSFLILQYITVWNIFEERLPLPWSRGLVTYLLSVIVHGAWGLRKCRSPVEMDASPSWLSTVTLPQTPHAGARSCALVSSDNRRNWRNLVWLAACRLPLLFVSQLKRTCLRKTLTLQNSLT
jgi:hypothetical protein